MITASTLYDFLQCPHRVHMDRFGDAVDRDEVSPFIELLWDKGNAYEKQVIESLDIPFVDLSAIADNDEREQATRRAIEAGEDLIYHGRLTTDDLLGEPDLLRLQNGRKQQYCSY